MDKLYIITFDPNAVGFNISNLHSCIEGLFKSAQISNWWHYLPSVYIVKSKLDPSTLYNNIYPSIPSQNFMVIEINATNKQGWMPKAAWDWFNN